MRHLFTSSLVATVFLLSSCSFLDSAEKKEFVAECNKNFDGDKVALCGCVFDGLEGKFTDQQMTRIPQLFTMSVPKSEELLRSSGKDYELEIADRIKEVKDVTRACVNKHK